MISKSIFLVFVIILSCECIMGVESNYVSDQLYADSLFNTHDYSNAIAEYKRLNYFYPNNPLFLINQNREFKSQYYTGQYCNLLCMYNSMNKELRNDIENKYFYAASLARSNMFETSIAFIDSIKIPLNCSEITDKDILRLQLLNYYKNNDDESADSLYNRYNTVFSENYFLKLSTQDYRDDINKHYWYVNILNIVPGLGYIPLKNYQNAITSFTTISFLYLSAAELYRNKLPFSGTILLSAGITFHMGSYLGINQYNNRLAKKHKDDIIEYLWNSLP